MTGIDLDGNEVVIEGDELLGRVFLHEIDHLDGVLMLDRLDPDERKRALRELRDVDLRRGGARTARRRPAPVSGSRLVYLGTPTAAVVPLDALARRRPRHRARRHPARPAARPRRRR